MTYPPQQPGQPYGQQPYSQPGQHFPVPYGQPHYPAHGPVQMVTVKERGFNPVTFGIHACLWIFLHSWLTLFTLGIWLVIAIPLTFFGWRVTKTVPVQQMQQPPYPPHYG